jgi:hypothetical protein
VEVDGKGARAHQTRYVRDASGAYLSTDPPNLYLFLVGDAARLRDPPWPELALAALCAGWGVRQHDHGVFHVEQRSLPLPDVPRGTSGRPQAPFPVRSREHSRPRSG